MINVFWPLCKYQQKLPKHQYRRTITEHQNARDNQHTQCIYNRIKYNEKSEYHKMNTAHLKLKQLQYEDSESDTTCSGKVSMFCSTCSTCHIARTSE